VAQSLVAILAAATLSGVCLAATVHLKDGGALKGKVVDPDEIKPADASIVIETQYGKNTVPREHIDRIEWDDPEIEVLAPTAIARRTPSTRTRCVPSRHRVTTSCAVHTIEASHSPG
jgi:hypothetical protein